MTSIINGLFKRLSWEKPVFLDTGQAKFDCLPQQLFRAVALMTQQLYKKGADQTMRKLIGVFMVRLWPNPGSLVIRPTHHCMQPNLILRSAHLIFHTIKCPTAYLMRNHKIFTGTLLCKCRKSKLCAICLLFKCDFRSFKSACICNH